MAMALCEPLRRADGPSRVLEVGAGTGPITRYLGTILGPGDELDICEIQPEFARILERDVLTNHDFAPLVAAGRVRLFQSPVQDLPYEDRYDFVISGLPLTAFELPLVEEVFTVIRRAIKPGGVLSYFEYVGLRRLSAALSLGPKRLRIRQVSDYLTDNIRSHQFDRRTVLRNLPPAHARHLRFEAVSRPAAAMSSAS
jgi:phosphatidylethanolamine/phosphatidyl-N-methylethanolamine N-methyltransferase